MVVHCSTVRKGRLLLLLERTRRKRWSTHSRRSLALRIRKIKSSKNSTTWSNVCDPASTRKSRWLSRKSCWRNCWMKRNWGVSWDFFVRFFGFVSIIYSMCVFSIRCKSNADLWGLDGDNILEFCPRTIIRSIGWWHFTICTVKCTWHEFRCSESWG